MIILYFLSIISLSVVSANDITTYICNTNFTNYQTEASSLETLSLWCARDPRCSYFFKQTEGNINSTIFNFLAYPIYMQEGSDLFYSLRKVLCVNPQTMEEQRQAIDALLEKWWTTLLVAGQMDNKPQCGAGQSFVLNEDEVKMECIFNMETFPSTPDNEYAFFLTIVIIICVFVMACCIFHLIKAVSVFRMLRGTFY